LADYEPFSGQRRTLSLAAIALAAAVGSFACGFILPSSQGTQTKTGHLALSQSGAKSSSQQGLSKVVTQLKQQAEADLLSFSIPTRFQGQVLKDIKLKSKEKVIALTFDDGPWPRSTVQILEILKKNKIKATFFMVGEPVAEYPQIAQQVVAAGHVIGNHTWHHWYRHMNPETAAREIEDTAALLYKVTGVKTSIFRPPGGVLNNGVVDYAKKHHYFVAMWSSDSIDYRRPSVPQLIHNVLKNAHSGGMVLMHDGGGDRSHTVEALPEIIAELKKSGYKFVTIPELLEKQDKELQAKEAITLKSASPGTSVQKSHTVSGN